MAVITNYTSYDQAYYYADLKRLPRLSEEERRRLTASLPLANDPQLTTRIKHQLIESYLPLAKYFAIDLCPKSRYQRDLPDLIGVANLTVVEVITRTDLAQIDDPTSYLAAWARGRIKGAIAHDGLVKIDHQARVRARERGETDQVYALDHLLSLDGQMEWFDSDDLQEPSAAPITPTEAAPPRDPQQRAQVEALLSYLSPRAQAIFRLRYGLSDDNEHRHTTAEIACALGLDRRLVLTTERDAITRLKALVAGKATIGKQNGKPCILYPDAHNRYTITPEQEAAMLRVCHDLEAQGVMATGRLLAQMTGISVGHALMFLRLHRSETPKEARARHRQQKLEQACTRLEARGLRVMSPLLAKEAGVMKKTAIDFLKARNEASHAAHAKRGSSYYQPKKRKRGHASSPTMQPVESSVQARLTLHDTDPITGNENTLYTLFYEFYRGYTIYSTPEGRCCIHAKQGCLRLRGQFICFLDIEDAKTLIKRFRANGYTSYDSVERYLPEWEFVCLNSSKQQGTALSSRPMQPVS